MRILNVHKNILISYAHKDLSIFCMYSNLSYSLAAQWIFTMQTREAPLYRNSIIAALWSHKLDKHIMGKWDGRRGEGGGVCVCAENDSRTHAHKILKNFPMAMGIKSGEKVFMALQKRGATC